MQPQCRGVSIAHGDVQKPCRFLRRAFGPEASRKLFGDDAFQIGRLRVRLVFRRALDDHNVFPARRLFADLVQRGFERRAFDLLMQFGQLARKGDLSIPERIVKIAQRLFQSMRRFV